MILLVTRMEKFSWIFWELKMRICCLLSFLRDRQEEKLFYLSLMAENYLNIGYTNICYMVIVFLLPV